MAEYLHGAYGKIGIAGDRVADASVSAIVYVGTAPVQNIEGGAANVNKPILINNIAEAKKVFGYSDDWASFTLCEAMHYHLEEQGVGPLVMINVFDPTKTAHKEATSGSASITPVNGVATIANAALIYMDSVAVTGKTKGTDYSIAYNADKKTIILTELSAGALGTDALAITYDIAKPSGVTAADVIGTTDDMGLNTGLYAIKNVYQLTGHIPAFLAAPGFSSVKAVHDAMYAISQKINGHWDAYMFVDLPLTDNGTALTLATAVTWKNANGYNKENETVYFPMVLGADGKKYHISVLAAGNFQAQLIENDGIPFHTASNTDCPIIENLYMGEANTARVYDDDIINKYLNKNGIASAAFVSGRWAVFGFASASYAGDTSDHVSLAETNRMMLFYVSNDFQYRRGLDTDEPLTPNDLKTIASEEQTRLDALVKIGALTYGEVEMNADMLTLSDVITGDYSFAFKVTATPLAKSLTAFVQHTDDGFVTYYESLFV